MHKALDIDLRAVQAQLCGRPFVRSSELLGSTEGIFGTREHGYRRVDDATFLHIIDIEVGQSYSLKLARPGFVCIQIVVTGTYSRWISDHVDSVCPTMIDISNTPLSVSDTLAGSKLRGILIVCQREHLVEHFKLNVDRVPAAYRPIFTSENGSLSALKLPARSNVIVAASQMLSCQYFEPLRHLYLNAKAMEIICEVVSQINGLSPQMIVGAPTTRSRRTAIDAAATIYRREIFNAPTIEQLATRVGLNRNDITKGFREAFGVTPHAYHHSLRMKEARQMLEYGQLSISEVARRVGYEGYSSFSRAYRAHFGQYPSAPKSELIR